MNSCLYQLKVNWILEFTMKVGLIDLSIYQEGFL